MKNRLLAICVAGLMALAGTSHAAFIETGNGVIDDVTNLEWLRLDNTNDLSYNQAKASTYATNDGYRHATYAELTTLLANAGMVETFPWGPSPTENTFGAQLLGGLWSRSAVYAPNPCCNLGILDNSGWYDNGSAGVTTTRASFGLLDGGDAGVNVSLAAPTASPDDVGSSPSAAHGNFMVRPSTVPIPAAAWLFGSALIGLAGIKRKK
jgi:hypothetical protein